MIISGVRSYEFEQAFCQFRDFVTFLDLVHTDSILVKNTTFIFFFFWSVLLFFFGDDCCSLLFAGEFAIVSYLLLAEQSGLCCI